MNTDNPDTKAVERLLLLWLAQKLKEFREAAQGTEKSSSSSEHAK